MPEAGFVFKGDAAQFFQEVAKMTTEWKKFQDEIKKTTGETKKLTQEEKTLGAERKRALDEIAGPQQRYWQRQQALYELLRQGTITQREYNAAAKEAQVRLEGAGKAGQDAFGPKGLGMARELIGALGSSVGVAGAVYVVKAAYSQWIAEIQEAGRVSTEFNANLIKGLAEAGELPRAAEVEKFVGGMPGIKREDALAAYTAIQQAAPEMSSERRKKLTAAVVPTAVAGMDVTRLGTLTAELAKMAPGMAPDDAADLAVYLDRVAGREAGQLTGKRSAFLKYARTQMAKGRPIEDVLAEGVAAIRGGYGAEDFKKLTPAERAQIPEFAVGAREAERTDAAAGVRTAFGGDATGRRRRRGYEAAAGLEFAKRAGGLAWEDWKTLQTEAKTEALNRGVPGPWITLVQSAEKGATMLDPRGPEAVVQRAQLQELQKLNASVQSQQRQRPVKEQE